MLKLMEVVFLLSIILNFQAHLAPQSHTQFNFQKYINRSLEEDFKVVVGIRSVHLVVNLLIYLVVMHILIADSTL